MKLLQTTVLVLILNLAILFVNGEGVSKQAYDVKTPATSLGKCGKPLYGITYSPFALNTESICLPKEQVVKDMEILAPMAHSIRTYSLATCLEDMEIICSSARENDQTVLLGLWIPKDVGTCEDEISVLMDFMHKYGDVIEAVIVGNESLFIQEVDIDVLIKYINRVRDMLRKEGFKHLVSSAEVWPALEDETGFKLVENLDFVCMNQQPYWEGWDVDCSNTTTECTTAGKYVTLKGDGLQSYFSESVGRPMPVWLCESGWPTKGEPCCSGERDNAQKDFKAIPSPEHATFFANDYITNALDRNLPFYLHGSFNEEWKRVWDPCDECEGRQVSSFSDDECDGCEVDYNWGLYDGNREPVKKFNLPKNYC